MTKPHDNHIEIRTSIKNKIKKGFSIRDLKVKDLTGILAKDLKSTKIIFSQEPFTRLQIFFSVKK